MLEKVTSVQRWQVAPTMTRGSRTTALATDVHFQKSEKADKADKADSAKPKKTEGKKTKSKSMKKTSKKKKSSKTQSKPVVPVSEYHDGMIRKTKSGRSVIIELMLEVMNLDEHIFPDYPAFEPSDGTCRLHFEGAKSFIWKDVLQYSPRAFEMLHLGQKNIAFSQRRTNCE